MRTGSVGSAPTVESWQRFQQVGDIAFPHHSSADYKESRLINRHMQTDFLHNVHTFTSLAVPFNSA